MASRKWENQGLKIKSRKGGGANLSNPRQKFLWVARKADGRMRKGIRLFGGIIPQAQDPERKIKK